MAWSNDTEKFLKYFKGDTLFVSILEDPKSKAKQKSNLINLHGQFRDHRNSLKDQNNNGGFSRSIFFTVNEFKNDGRLKKDIKTFRCLYTDDDVIKDKPRTDFELPANIIVESSKGKFHYYWLIKDPENMDAKLYEGIENHIVKKYNTDKNVKDISRIMRLPGFNHVKNTANPFEVKFLINPKAKHKAYPCEFLKLAFNPDDIPEENKRADGVVADANYLEYCDSEGKFSLDLCIKAQTPDKDGNIAHKHGPSRNYSWYLAASNVPEKFSLELLNSNLPNIKPERHSQNFKSAVDKLSEREDGLNVRTIELIPEPKKMMVESKSFHWPDCVVGSAIANAYECQKYQDKNMAITTGIGLFGGVSGRRHNINGLGLNTYQTFLADTARGKESITDFIVYALLQANKNLYGSFCGYDDFTGDLALMVHLKEHPCYIAVVTEAGLGAKVTSGNQEGLRKQRLSIYSRGGAGKFSSGKKYSNSANNIPIVASPCLTVISEATPNGYLEAMEAAGARESGEFGRIIVSRNIGSRPNFNHNFNFVLDEDVKKSLSKLMTFNCEIKGDNPPNPKILKLPDNYMDVSRYYDQKFRDYESIDRVKAVMVSRGYEKFLKISSALGVGDGLDQATPEMAEWSFEYLKFLDDGLDVFFSGTGTGLFAIAMSSVGMEIAKCLKDPSGRHDSVEFRRRGIVSHGVLYDHCRGLRELLDFDDDPGKVSNPKLAFRKIIDILISAGMIIEITPKQIRMIGISNQLRVNAYKITDEFSISAIYK